MAHACGAVSPSMAHQPPIPVLHGFCTMCMHVTFHTHMHSETETDICFSSMFSDLYSLLQHKLTLTLVAS